jgi:hypothetical protein
MVGFYKPFLSSQGPVVHLIYFWLKMPVDKIAAWCVGSVLWLSFGVTDNMSSIKGRKKESKSVNKETER